jgi:type IV pilus assembly protein PilV
VLACDPTAPLAGRDLCEWGQLMAGADERIGGQNAGVLVGAIGCVHELDAFNRVYAVSISWMAANPGPAPVIDPNFPPTGCGLDRFGNENQRRVMTTLLRIGNLNAVP